MFSNGRKYIISLSPQSEHIEAKCNQFDWGYASHYNQSDEGTVSHYNQSV